MRDGLPALAIERLAALAFVALVACGSAPAPVAASDPCADPALDGGAVYDLNCSFSLTTNPSGGWEYGFSSPGTPDRFQPLAHADPGNPVGLWHPDARSYYPYVAWNSTPLARVDATDSWAVRPREVAMEAAPGGGFSIARFTAPQAGVYLLQATFEGIHFRHSTTDVHVRQGATALFDAEIDGYGGHPAFHAMDGTNPSTSFSRELSLQAGDEVSFAVGVGTDAANANDTTGLMARMTRLRSAARRRY